MICQTALIQINYNFNNKDFGPNDNNYWIKHLKMENGKLIIKIEYSINKPVSILAMSI